MIGYSKPWLTLEGQIAKLRDRGVEVDSLENAEDLLRHVGYYRLTGYLYPFREFEKCLDDNGREHIRVRDAYRRGTSIAYAAELIDYDRKLRMFVLDAVERIEVSLRMQIGYTPSARVRHSRTAIRGTSCLPSLPATLTSIPVNPAVGSGGGLQESKRGRTDPTNPSSRTFGSATTASSRSGP